VGRGVVRTSIGAAHDSRVERAPPNGILRPSGILTFAFRSCAGSPTSYRDGRKSPGGTSTACPWTLPDPSVAPGSVGQPIEPFRPRRILSDLRERDPVIARPFRGSFALYEGRRKGNGRKFLPSELPIKAMCDGILLA